MESIILVFDDMKSIFPEELVKMSISNVESDDKELLSSKKIVFKVGDGWKGDPENAPFDVIHVGAAAESMPKANQIIE